MSSNDTTHETPDHANPVDRNRAISWARYLMDSDEWVIMALKVTRRTVDSRPDQPSLITVALLNNVGNIRLEAMVKTPYMVSNEEIAQHGVDYSVVYNAKPYDQVRDDIIRAVNSREMVVWDAPVMHAALAELDHYFNLSERAWKFYCASSEYARFRGVKAVSGAQYEVQPLPQIGLSAVDECRSVYKIISEMAASSQFTDPIAGGRPGWTAEFYRPKINTGDKLKGMFGFKS